jgi:predicted transcriptional regulator
MAKTLTNTSNRDRIDIIASILDAANGGATRRKILLVSGLSGNQFKRYLSILAKEGYIEMENGERSRIYKTTSEGIAFLYAFHHVRELLEQEPDMPSIRQIEKRR